MLSAGGPRRVSWRRMTAVVVLLMLTGGLWTPRTSALAKEHHVVESASTLGELGLSEDPQLDADSLSAAPPTRSVTLSMPSTRTLQEQMIRNILNRVSYPDTNGEACEGELPEYCTYPMVPHCHGVGESKFCHSHPGGEYRHTHENDGE